MTPFELVQMMLPKPWHITLNAEPSGCDMTSVLDNGWLLESVRSRVAEGEKQLHNYYNIIVQHKISNFKLRTEWSSVNIISVGICTFTCAKQAVYRNNM